MTTPEQFEQALRQSQEVDWTEDASHENGNYFCDCTVCGRVFVGHKRRVVCKLCAHK